METLKKISNTIKKYAKSVVNYKVPAMSIFELFIVISIVAGASLLINKSASEIYKFLQQYISQLKLKDNIVAMTPFSA